MFRSILAFVALYVQAVLATRRPYGSFLATHAVVKATRKAGQESPREFLLRLTSETWAPLPYVEARGREAGFLWGDLLQIALSNTSLFEMDFDADAFVRWATEEQENLKHFLKKEDFSHRDTAELFPFALAMFGISTEYNRNNLPEMTFLKIRRRMHYAGEPHETVEA